MVRAFRFPHTSAPDALPGLWLMTLLCLAALVSGCDDVGSDGTWAPFASPPASEVNTTATASTDSAAVASAPAKADGAVANDVPPFPFRTASAPADAIPALIAATEPITWADTAWPAARTPELAAEGSTGEPAAPVPADSSMYTEEEAAALIAEAAAVLDARPTIPADISATTARQDTLVENLSDEALAAYEDPALADDTSTDPPPTTDTPDADPEPAQLSLDMVIDETRSTQGRDFYNIFYRNWQAPEGAMNYTVYVREQPGRGRGSVVEVRVNDEIAFRSQLQPRYDVIEQTAHQAVRYTQQFMQRVDVSRRIY
jgi:hypothetical protein